MQNIVSSDIGYETSLSRAIASNYIVHSAVTEKDVVFGAILYSAVVY